jgi:molecular chaperone GrpE
VNKKGTQKKEPKPTVSKTIAGDQPQDRITELTADLQRLQAEFANYKRRESEAKAELIDLARQDVVRELLPLLDNLDRALAHQPEHLKNDAWAQGVAQIARQATESLAKLGVTRIETVGQPFDHNLHEAISMEDGDGDQEVVTEELQAGYTMGDKVVRHAMVKVGKH